MAETVSGAVVDNVNSVFSALRQTTHDIQDTIEFFTLGTSIESVDVTVNKSRKGSLSSGSSTPSAQDISKKQLLVSVSKR